MKAVQNEMKYSGLEWLGLRCYWKRTYRCD